VVVDKLPTFFGFVANQSPAARGWASAGLRPIENKLADDERVFFTEHFHFDIFKEETAHVELVGIVGAISGEHTVISSRDSLPDEGDGGGFLIGPDELVDVTPIPGFGLIVEDFFDRGFFACGRERESKGQYKNQSHARNYSL